MARKTKLTDQLIETVSENIRQGAWDYVACEAAGISQVTFYQWLKDAQVDEPDPMKVKFSKSVEQARAEARQRAELAVMADKPETWLLKGPGREKAGRPGWASENTLTVETKDNVTVNLEWDTPTDEPDTDA